MKKFILCVILGYLIIMWIVFAMMAQVGDGPTGEGRTSDGIRAKADSISEKQDERDIGFRKPGEMPERIATKPEPIRTYYQDGSISTEWEQAHREKPARLRTFYPDGAVWMDLSFAGGRPEGLMRFYHPKGTVFWEASYKQGLPDGPVNVFYTDGRPWAGFEYAESMVQKNPAFYSESGHQEMLPKVQTESDTGYFKAYDANGEVMMNWQKAGETEQTEIKTYYTEGAVSGVWSLKDETLDGPSRLFYRDGALRVETAYRGGAFTGPTSFFDKQGQIRFEIRIQEVTGRRVLEAYYPSGLVCFTLSETVRTKAGPVYTLKTYWEEETPKGHPANLLSVKY